MRLVDDWKKVHKWLSTWLVGAAATMLQLYEMLPQFQANVPPKVFHHLMTALVILIIVGRLIKQGQSDAPPQ